jgi:predicted GIY-YIG superfamily endonuclease
MPEPTERAALYRLYDMEGRLLYVGVTNELRRRWQQHSTSQKWWHLVARRVVEWHESRAAAELAETAAIEAEMPLYNIDQVPNATASQGQYDDTADRRRVKRLLRRDAARQYFHPGKTVHLLALAERYDVSRMTVWSVMNELDPRCFTEARQRITITRQPAF